MLLLHAYAGNVENAVDSTSHCGKVFNVLSSRCTRGEGGDQKTIAREYARRTKISTQSASTAAARHGAQWTRWRFIEAFGGCLPVAYHYRQGTGTKQWGNLLDKTCVMIHLHKNT